MVSSAKMRAKEKGLFFDLLITDFEIPVFCPVFTALELGAVASYAHWADMQGHIQEVDATDEIRQHLPRGGSVHGYIDYGENFYDEDEE